MRIAVAMFVASFLSFAGPARAQSPANPTVSVPRLIAVTGTYQPASGQPAPASVAMTFSVYAESAGGAAVWQETQDVTLDRTGRYVVQLGATRPDGLPVTVFADNEERWLGVQIADEAERPRTRLTSVPYALRAADAETLGGHPASAYVLAPP